MYNISSEDGIGMVETNQYSNENVLHIFKILDYFYKNQVCDHLRECLWLLLCQLLLQQPMICGLQQRLTSWCFPCIIQCTLAHHSIFRGHLLCRATPVNHLCMISLGVVDMVQLLSQLGAVKVQDAVGDP